VAAAGGGWRTLALPACLPLHLCLPLALKLWHILLSCLPAHCCCVSLPRATACCARFAPFVLAPCTPFLSLCGCVCVCVRVSTLVTHEPCNAYCTVWLFSRRQGGEVRSENGQVACVRVAREVVDQGVNLRWDAGRESIQGNSLRSRGITGLGSNQSVQSSGGGSKVHSSQGGACKESRWVSQQEWYKEQQGWWGGTGWHRVRLWLA
jgi:hypothetical protein